MKNISIRYIAILLFTAVIIAMTRDVWSSKPPIIVSFHVEVTKPVDVEIKWAESADAPFRAEVGVFRKVTPADREVVVELPARRVSRFRVDAGSYPGKLTLSKLQLSSGDTVVQFNDFSRFAYYNIEDKTIEPGRLKLNSSHLDPYMEYQLPLQLKKKRQYDWFALGIIIILSVLMSSVLVNTVRYTMVGRSKMEWKNAVFCTLLCCLFIIPVVKMDKRDILPEENRRMAGFPKLLKAGNGGLNYEFGKQFESWLQDRFTGRRSFIKRYDRVMSLMNGRVENNVGIMYANGWMFYKPWSEQIFRQPSEYELARITQNLSKVQSFCDEQGINFYVLICPVKEDVYAHLHPTSRTSGSEVNTALVNYMKLNAPDIHVVYPRELVAKQALKNLLYYKTDTHQNEDGAYVINSALLAEIKQDMPALPLPEKDDFNVTKSRKVGVGREISNGYIYWVLGIKDEAILDEAWSYYTLKNDDRPVVSENEIRERKSLYRGAQGKAILLGDSFTENQALWLQYSFGEMHKWRCNNSLENNEMRFERWEERIRTEKPDALIICVSASDSFFHFNNLYKN